MRLPGRRGTQRRRAHRRNWRDATSLCTMRDGAMRWNFRTAWSGRKTRTGMGVREGKPEQSWTYKEADDAIEKNDAVQQFGAAPPVLMVLTSEKGWPYSRNTMHDLPKDVFVNCGVGRVWQIVKGDLTAWLSPHGGTDFTPKRRVLIETPGIGNRWLPARTSSTSCCTAMWRNSKWWSTVLVEEMRTCLTRPPER
ncbi:putative retrotransposon hot spot protein (RHS) [Trypanosoma cruzi]|uniref:Putative retrotransposon hot spot protein (RHS) n=1 Tax=Trypanosoma cruzi TaxID=5693 RepID=A0A2V2V9R3_TRYCR|nr:putative retrotransposon hot spot protein (RHS) [Trypanosoma cruzi]